MTPTGYTEDALIDQPAIALLGELGRKSIRRNALLADLLHRITFIEKAGTGIKRMREEARAQEGAVPQVPHKQPTSTPQVTGQVGTKLALSRHQVEILKKCFKDSMLVDLMAIAERSDRTKFRHQVLNPLIEARFIEMTVPEKPRSSKQRYRITPAGRAILERQAEEAKT